MKISQAQKKSMIDKGVLRLNGLVPAARIAAALREINRALARSSSYGKDGLAAEPGRRPWDESSRSQAIESLFYDTPVQAAVAALLGKNSVEPDLPREIVLRFPQDAGAAQRTNFHVDGFEYGGGTRARQHVDDGHTLAAAVLLSDVPRAGMGNLSLIPRSHRALARHFARSPAALDRREMPRMKLEPPMSVVGRAGDVILSHGQVAHSAFAYPNLSAHIHYAVVFWVSRVGHRDRWRETALDLWLEWPGIRRGPLTERKR